jgi:hypothetical protein
MKYSKLKNTKQVRSVIKNSKNKTNRRKKRGLTVKFSKKLRRYKKKTPSRRKPSRRRKRGGSGYESDPNQYNKVAPILSESPPRKSYRDGNYDSDNYSSISSSLFSTPRTSMSSLGDFEHDESDEIRDIVAIIEKYVFFVSTYDSDSFSVMLNEEINKLDVYDLYRKVEYIWNEVYKMETRADTELSEKKIREVFNTLKHILDVIPNTRGNTPIEEFESGPELESLINRVSNLNLNVDESGHNKDNKYFRGGKRSSVKRRTGKQK